MPPDESERPSTRLLSYLVTGVVIGTIVAALDLAWSIRVGHQAADWTTRLSVLSLLPLRASGSLLIVALIPDRFHGFALGAVAFILGRELASGPRAAHMFLAAYWGYALGFAAILVAEFSRRLRKPRTVAVIAAVIGVAMHASTAVFFRGHYAAVRAATDGAAACLLVPAARWIATASRTGITSIIALGIVTFSAVAGPISLRRQKTIDWAIDAGTAVSAPAMIVRRIVAPDRRGDFIEVNDFPPPVIGSELGSRAIARLPDGRGFSRVLMILVDSMRSDFFRSTRNGIAITPNMDRRARGGFAFTRAYAAAPSSCFSILSILSGVSAAQVARFQPAPDALPLVTDILRSQGIRCRAMIPSIVFTLRPRGFARVDLGFAPGMQLGETDPRPEEIADKLFPPSDDGRSFGYLHLIGPHDPHAAPSGNSIFGRSDVDQYAAELHDADERIEALLTILERSGRLARTLVIIGADHGEEFGEHGRFHHGTQLYEESIHVPLLLLGDGVIAGHYDAPVSLIDLAPTIEHAFDVSPVGRPSRAGRSLLPLAVGLDDPSRYTFVVSDCPPPAVKIASTLSACIGTREKLIIDEDLSRYLLFDLSSDPSEKLQIAEERANTVAEMRGRQIALQRRAVDIDIREVTPIDVPIDIISQAERLSPEAAMNELMAFGRDEPRAVVAAASYLSDAATPSMAKSFAKRFGPPKSDSERTAIRMIEFASGIAEKGAREELLTTIRVSLDPVVIGGIIRAFAARRDPGIADLKLPELTDARSNLSLRLALADYAARIGHGSFDLELIEHCFADRSEWLLRRALEWVNDLAIDVDLLQLRRTLEESGGAVEAVRVKAAAIRLLGSRGDIEDIRSVLKCVNGEDRYLASKSLSALAARARRGLKFPAEVTIATTPSLGSIDLPIAAGAYAWIVEPLAESATASLGQSPRGTLLVDGREISFGRSSDSQAFGRIEIAADGKLTLTNGGSERRDSGADGAVLVLVRVPKQ